MIDFRFIFSIPMSAAFTQINLDSVMKYFRRFYSVCPSSEIDMVMFVSVLRFIGRFVDVGKLFFLRLKFVMTSGCRSRYSSVSKRLFRV